MELLDEAFVFETFKKKCIYSKLYYIKRSFKDNINEWGLVKWKIREFSVFFFARSLQ